MTADEFRLLALGLPQVRYASTLGAINFMVGERVFASLGGPNPGLAIVKLSPEDQGKALRSSGAVFFPQPGGAGARGVTCVRLSTATPDLIQPALRAAVARARQARPASGGVRPPA